MFVNVFFDLRESFWSAYKALFALKKLLLARFFQMSSVTALDVTHAVVAVVTPPSPLRVLLSKFSNVSRARIGRKIHLCHVEPAKTVRPHPSSRANFRRLFLHYCF